MAGLAAFWLYTRFGWMYAAWAAAIAISFIPFQFHLPLIYGRFILAGVLTAIFSVTYWFSMHTRPDYQRSRNQVLQAGLLIGIYLTLNQQLQALPLFGGWQQSYGATTRAAYPAAYWITYALCWALPLTLLVYGVLRRRRVLLDVGLLTLGITFATNKDYLGFAHKPWDPIVFGFFWISLAAVAHWLLSDVKRADRWKLTNKNILRPENHGFDISAAGVALVGPSSEAPASLDRFGDGQSGGAGASRGF
jgi:hypothetical protein